MKNSKGDIEFEIIDDGLNTTTWKASATGAGEVEEKTDNQKKMVATGYSTNTAVHEENVRDSVIKGEFKVGSDEIDEFLSENDRGEKIKKIVEDIKEARKQTFKKNVEKENSAIEDPYAEKHVCCGNKAELVMNKMAIIYGFIDSLRDDLTIAEVKKRFFE